MIFIGLGANLAFKGQSPQLNMENVRCILAQHPDMSVLACSRFYVSAPVGPVDQPDFLNAVVSLQSGLSPENLMAFLLDLERQFGRVRSERWGPRTMDLDLIDYDGKVLDIEDGEVALQLPHPRLHERGFVLVPLAEIEPKWRHPVSGRLVADLIGEIGPEQALKPL